MVTAKELLLERATDDTYALSVGLSVLAVMDIVLVFMALMKVVYLKHRRIQMIHHLPAFLSPSTVDITEAGLDHSQFGRGRSGEHGRRGGNDVLIDIDPLGAAPPRGSSRQSKCTSRSRATSSNASRRSPAPSPIPGIIVGLLGSPAWETRMRREADNHRWRQRHDASLSAPSWLSQQTLQSTATRYYTPNQSRPPSRESHLPSSQSIPRVWEQTVVRPQSQSQTGTHTLPRRRPRSAQFHAERKTVTRVTSFGELGTQEVDVRIRRPHSLSAVVDQAMIARYTQAQDLSQRGDRTRPLSDARSQIDHSSRSRPSPIVEEVPSPVPSPGVNRDPQLGGPYGIRTSGTTASSVDMSLANSMSFGQLRHFPSPPESMVVSTVFVPDTTIDLDELEKGSRSSKDNQTFSNCVPFMNCNDQVPWHNGYFLSCNLSSSSGSSSTTLRDSYDCDYSRKVTCTPVDDQDVGEHMEVDCLSTFPMSTPPRSAPYDSESMKRTKHSSFTFTKKSELETEPSAAIEEPLVHDTPTVNDETPPSASSRRLAFVLSIASSRSSCSFRSVLSGRYSFSLAAGASAIMSQPEDATVFHTPSSGRLSTLSSTLDSPVNLRNSVLVSLPRRHTIQSPGSPRATGSQVRHELSPRTPSFLFDSPGVCGTDRVSRPLSLQDVQEEDTLVFEDKDYANYKTTSALHKSFVLRDSQFRPFDQGSNLIGAGSPDSNTYQTGFGARETLASCICTIAEPETEEIDLGLVDLATLSDSPDNGNGDRLNRRPDGLDHWDPLFCSTATGHGTEYESTPSANLYEQSSDLSGSGDESSTVET